MAAVVFFLAATGAIAGAVGVITVRNPFYSVLALVGHLVCLALLFLLLRAEFVAAAQVVVYAGAVMVLYVFVVAYVGGTGEPPLSAATGARMKALSVVFALGLFVELAVAVLGSSLKGIDSQGAPYATGFGTPAEIGRLLLTDFLLPFEVASFLLLIAAVGAVTLARRRGGLETEAELSSLTPLDFVRPAYTGTMAEAVGGPRRLPAPEASAAQPGAPSEDEAGIHVGEETR